MALDVAKLRRRLPPPPTDGNPAVETPPPAPVESPSQARAGAMEEMAGPRPLDGRRLRATGRTVQLNLKVTEETKARFLALAAARGVMMSELFEEAVALLEKDAGR